MKDFFELLLGEPEQIEKQTELLERHLCLRFRIDRTNKETTNVTNAIQTKPCAACGFETPFGITVKRNYLCGGCSKDDQATANALSAIATRAANETRHAASQPVFAAAGPRLMPEQPAFAPAPQARYYCNECMNYTNVAKMRGNGWIELVAYLFYLVPGIIYSIWRRSGQPNVCPVCRKEGLVPASSAIRGGPVAGPSSATFVRNEIDCPSCAEPILAKAKVCKHCGNPVAIVSLRST